MASIYIHIPFCRHRCGYCDFYSVGSLERRGEVVEGIKQELEQQKGYFGDTDNTLQTIYFGGGTPSVCSPAELQSVVDKIAEIWDISAVSEITIEANPDDLTQEYIVELAGTHINRLSIGIQSFDDQDLLLMNRHHTGRQAAQAVARAQAAGFDNITVDLIYGIPQMSLSTWRDNIAKAIDLGVQHISAYHLSIEPGSAFARQIKSGKLSVVDEAVSEQQYEILHQMLTTAGFEHYEISNFARLSFRARHNSAYWSGDPYLGVGPSAHSFNGNERRWSHNSVKNYAWGVGDGTIYETETLSPADKINEYVMIALRKSEGISIAQFADRFGVSASKVLLTASQPLLANGLLALRDDQLTIPFDKFLISDSIVCQLFIEQ